MNNTGKKDTLKKFKAKVMTILLIPSVLIMFISYAIIGRLSKPAETVAVEDTIARLEESVKKQQAIADAAVKISDLAKASGYELAIDEVIRDHGESMKAVKEDLEKLSAAGGNRKSGALAGTFIILMILYTVFVVSYARLLIKRLSIVLDWMGKQIDNVMEEKTVELWDEGKTGLFSNYYYKFMGALKLFESEWTGKNISGPKKNAKTAGKKRNTTHSKD